jgi:hypothetical protein
LQYKVDGVEHEPPVATCPELVPGPVEPHVPANAQNGYDGPWDSDECDVGNVPVVLEIVNPGSIFIECITLIFWKAFISIFPLEFIVVLVWVIVVVGVVVLPVFGLVLINVVPVIVNVPIINDWSDAFDYWSNSFL